MPRNMFPVFRPPVPSHPGATTNATPAYPAPPSGEGNFWSRLTELAGNVAEIARLLRQLPTYYPWIESPPDAQPFDFPSVIPTPAVGVPTAVLTVPVPVGWDGCLLGLANVYLGPGALDYSIPSIVWRIFIDQRQVNGYNNIITQFGETSFPRPISPLRVFTGQTLTYQVTVNDPALPGPGSFIYANFTGRFWPHRKS
jgi:hypothetical protein